MTTLETEQRTFVWLPGWSASPGVFQREIARWPAATHLAADLSACESPGEIDARVEKTLASTGSAPVVIVGWSLGAMAALRAAGRARLPSARLCLVGASARFVAADGLGWPEPVLRRMRRRLREDPAEVLRQFDRRLFSPAESAAGARERWAAEHGERLPTAPALDAGLAYLTTFAVDGDEELLHAPVHLFHGDRDEICPPEAVARLARMLPQSSLTMVEGAGHAPFWTQAEEFHGWLRRAIF